MHEDIQREGGRSNYKDPDIRIAEYYKKYGKKMK